MWGIRRRPKRSSNFNPDEIAPLPDDKYARLRQYGESDNTVVVYEDHPAPTRAPEFENEEKLVQWELPGAPPQREKEPRTRRLF